MDINQEQQLFAVFLLQLTYIIYYPVHLRKNKLSVFSVEPIQIFASNPSPRVAQNNSVRIKHRHDLEYYFTSNPFGFWAFVYQPF